MAKNSTAMHCVDRRRKNRSANSPAQIALPRSVSCACAGSAAFPQSAELQPMRDRDRAARDEEIREKDDVRRGMIDPPKCVAVESIAADHRNADRWRSYWCAKAMTVLIGRADRYARGSKRRVQIRVGTARARDLAEVLLPASAGVWNSRKRKGRPERQRRLSQTAWSYLVCGLGYGPHLEMRSVAIPEET